MTSHVLNNNNNAFSDLLEEEMSETDTDNLWWDNNLV